jgi:hypothetical protein
MTRRRLPHQPHGRKVVVAVHRVGTRAVFDLRESRHRNHVAGRVLHVQAADVFRRPAVLAFGRHQHLPHAAELVEVVHIEGTQRAGQRIECIVQRHTERLGAFAVDIDVKLRCIRPPQCLQATGEHRALVRGADQRTHVLDQPLRAAVAAVLQIELEAAGVAQPEDRRRIEGQHQCFLDARRLAEHLADQLLRGHAAFVPVLLADEDGGRAVLEAAADEVHAGKRHHVFVRVVRLDGLHHFGHHLVGAFQRGAVRQEHGDDEIALILVRHQRSGRLGPQAGGDRHHADEQQNADRRAADHPGHGAGVAVRDTREPVVEPQEDARLALVLVLQQGHAQCRRHGQCDHAGQHDRNGDGDRELPVQLARQAAEEGDRHEYGRQHQHDGDDRAGHLLHRLNGCIARHHLLLVHDAFDVLQHHDRVIDHDADGQHHAEQRERVDRIAEHMQAGEGAEQRHRHRQQRNQRGAPVLQEHEHHDEHQDHRLAQRLHHLGDRHFDETRGVVRNGWRSN